MEHSTETAGQRASPEEFVILHRFMMNELGLSGVPLLVYARIYGFASSGLDFFESKAHIAAFLNVTERSVYRAFGDLVSRGLIEERGYRRHPGGIETKRYSIVWSAVPARARGPCPDEMSPPEKTSPPERTSCRMRPGDDEPSGASLTNCLPIRKNDNKDFG